MDIPYLVRPARLALGQTQSQFAEQFEVDDGTVSRWERGKLRPSPASSPSSAISFCHSNGPGYQTTTKPRS